MRVRQKGKKEAEWVEEKRKQEKGRKRMSK